MVENKYSPISVIIPCHNEAEVIADNIRTIDAYLRPRFSAYEIIAVSDGSTDDTDAILNRLRTAEPQVPLTIIGYAPNRGKGYAVKQGVLASRHDTILFLDADLTIPIRETENFLPKLAQSDIVIASRALPETVFEEPVPSYRFILAKLFRFLESLILGDTVADTQCGFKLFNRRAANLIFPKLTVERFAFDAEIIFLARKAGLAIKEMPVTIGKDARNTNVSILRDPINMFFALLKIRRNDLTGKYDLSVGPAAEKK